MADETVPKPDSEIGAPITVNIGNLCKGAIITAFDRALQECINNIYDLATPARAARGISLKVKLKPTDARDKIVATFECDSTLAQPHPVDDIFYVGKDPETGTLYGLTEDPRQQQIVFTPPKPKEAPKPLEFLPAKK